MQGTAFGRQVVSIVEAQVAATPSSDLPGLAFWWDNVVHLKAVLQTLGSGAFAATVSTRKRRQRAPVGAALLILCIIRLFDVLFDCPSISRTHLGMRLCSNVPSP